MSISSADIAVMALAVLRCEEEAVCVVLGPSQRGDCSVQVKHNCCLGRLWAT